MSRTTARGDDRQHHIGNLLVAIVAIVAALAFGFAHGYAATNSFDYFGHFLVGGLISLFLYGTLRLLPDSTPDFALLILTIVTIVFLSTSHITAYQLYASDALIAEREYLRSNPAASSLDFWRSALNDTAATGSVWDNIRLHVSQGMFITEREFISYGEQVQRLRSGFWAAWAWFVQLTTLPVLVGLGVVCGAFRAHLKTHDPTQLQTALEYLLEARAVEMSPFKWQSAGGEVRPFNFAHLLNDFYHSYWLFWKPIAILVLFQLVFPAHESKALFSVMFSFFMLHSANAILTGNHERMRLRFGVIFEQMLLFVRFFAYLFLSLFLGWILALVVAAPFTIIYEGKETIQVTHLGLMLSIQVVVLVRLWPMLVMHYLFDDVRDESLENLAGRARHVLRTNLWFGAPGPSLVLAWRFTGQAGTFLRATLPALLIPVLVLYLAFSAREMIDGWLATLWQALMIFLIAPLLYLLLMDRAIALREAFMTSQEDSEEDASELAEDMSEFLDQIPAAFVKQGPALAEVGRSAFEARVLAETEDDPDELLRRAVAHGNEAWFSLALERGADPNATRETGPPLIFTACRTDRVDLLTKLVNAGAAPDARDRSGRTLFHLAATRANAALLMRTLSGCGCDVNATDEHGLTPMAKAAEHDFVSNLETLMDLGGDLYGHLPGIMRASIHRNGTQALVWLLAITEDQRSHYINDAGIVAGSVNHPDALRLLLDAGMDPELAGESRVSLLFSAVSHCQPASVDILLAHGADPFREDGSGRTPRDYAFDFDGRQRQAYDKIEAALTLAMDRLTR